MSNVEALARAVSEKHDSLDVICNNAGVFKTSNPITANGLDIHFQVNTIAPYILTQCLLTLMTPSGRVVNVASAGQAPVNLAALKGTVNLSNFDAYAQSKLAIIMWTNSMARDHSQMMVSINPGSMLGTKMVKEGFGVEGKDIGMGADILVREVLSKEFDHASGKYFDRDLGKFAKPHPDALNTLKCDEVVSTIDAIISSRTAK